MRWARLKAAIKAIYLFLDEVIVPLPAPGRPTLVSHRKVAHMESIGYTLGAPEAPIASDVVKLRLYCSLDGVDQTPIDVKPGGTQEIIAPVGAKVVAYFTALDAYENESAHGIAWDITAIDDEAPAAPGAPTLVSRRFIMDPATDSADTGGATTPATDTTNPPSTDATIPPADVTNPPATGDIPASTDTPANPPADLPVDPPVA